MRMGPLAGKDEVALLVAFELRAVGDQVADDILGGADHDFNRLPVIFIVAGLHSVLKIAVVVRFVLEHADAALGKIGVAALQVCL